MSACMALILSFFGGIHILFFQNALEFGSCQLFFPLVVKCLFPSLSAVSSCSPPAVSYAELLSLWLLLTILHRCKYGRMQVVEISESVFVWRSLLSGRTLLPKMETKLSAACSLQEAESGVINNTACKVG